MAIISPARQSVPGDRPSGCSWQQALATAVRDPATLCRLLQLPAACQAAAAEAAEQFPLVVPLPYIARMRPGDVHDPLLRQILPRQEECQLTPGYQSDPVGDGAAVRCPGLLHKYAGRALILAADACGVHCRFCFRRHFPAQLSAAGDQARWSQVLATLAADQSIGEVVLSGGEPLMLPDSDLANRLASLAQVPHLRRVRIHCRLPIVIPQRVTGTLLAALRSTRLPVLMVLHVNHPAELDDPVGQHLACLLEAGIPLLSQSVLLRGVNDQLETLVQLYHRLADLRVMAYYLHQLDPVQGAAHFHVPATAGRQLVDQLKTRLPGYAVPRYVREVPGAASKLEL